MERWLQSVRVDYKDHLLGVDASIVDEWGRMTARRSGVEVDALLAATAKVHSLTLVTRNVKDVFGLGADVLNPFEPPAIPRR